jgi:hypothetical protein
LLNGRQEVRGEEDETKEVILGDWGCGRTGTGYARGDSDEKLGLAKLQKAFAGK